jgi:hypothetical protein
MLTREESVDEFLKSGLWHIAEDREQTRRAVREFLLELPEDHFCRLRRGIAGLVVLAPSVFLGWTLLALEDVPPATPEYKQHFQTLHFDSRIEQYPYDQARAMMFEALTLAFAVAVDGLDERTAGQFAAALGRMDQRMETRRKN